MGTGAIFRDNQSVPGDRVVTQKSLPSPFSRALAQRPTALAHGWLAMIHEQVTGDTAKAATHRRMGLAIRGGLGSE